jgi:F-type H+-transporting ATPase subunit gamma
MPVGTKALKKRIASVKNTKKMTKAMEMVSAAKMRKSVTAAQKTRLFTTLNREIVSHLSFVEGVSHPLMEQKESGKTLLVLLTSNRGLCGSYNSNVIKETKQYLVSNGLTDIDVLGIGKKSAVFCKRYGFPLVGVYEEFSDKPDFEAVLPVVQRVVSEFTLEKYSHVYIAYTDFKSPVLQQVSVRQLLPLTREAFDALRGKNSGETQTQGIDNYIFEPSQQEIVDEIVPRLVEVLFYQMILESSASEHSSRMVAMKNATDNASDLIDDMTLVYNKARQAAITQEISEIVGGAVALE